ncbi:MAG: hypothetical protein M5U08_16505 [Burkholderiales bacterium]|nr:hypothetical protein [Burkholderiales bacterium]
MTSEAIVQELTMHTRRSITKDRGGALASATDGIATGTCGTSSGAAGTIDAGENAAETGYRVVDDRILTSKYFAVWEPNLDVPISGSVFDEFRAEDAARRCLIICWIEPSFPLNGAPDEQNAQEEQMHSHCAL